MDVCFVKTDCLTDAVFFIFFISFFFRVVVFQDRALDDMDIYSSFSYPLLDGELTVSVAPKIVYIITFFI